MLKGSSVSSLKLYQLSKASPVKRTISGCCSLIIFTIFFVNSFPLKCPQCVSDKRIILVPERPLSAIGISTFVTLTEKSAISVYIVSPMLSTPTKHPKTILGIFMMILTRSTIIVAPTRYIENPTKTLPTITTVCINPLFVHE